MKIQWQVMGAKLVVSVCKINLGIGVKVTKAADKLSLR